MSLGTVLAEQIHNKNTVFHDTTELFCELNMSDHSIFHDYAFLTNLLAPADEKKDEGTEKSAPEADVASSGEDEAAPRVPPAASAVDTPAPSAAPAPVVEEQISLQVR